jgi:hypothetical protein
MECFSTSSHTGICGFLISYLAISNEVALSVFASVYNKIVIVLDEIVVIVGEADMLHKPITVIFTPA